MMTPVKVTRIFIVLLAMLVLSGLISRAEAAVCGDVNSSNQIDIADAVFLINYIFASGPTPLDDGQGDFNCSNQTDIADAVFMVNYIFASGPAPCSGPGCAIGVLLTGDSDSLAVSATSEYGPIAVDSSEIDSTGLLTTRIDAVANPAATIGAVNAALNSIGGRISWMTPGGLLVTIAVPAVQSRQEADSLGEILVTSGAFLIADAAFQADLNSAVEIAELPPTGTGEIFHLRQMRMPAAWNLRELIESRNADVIVFVPDGYYRTTPHPEIPAQTFVIGEGKPELVSTVDGNHGFCTSGIIGAKHDDKNTTGLHSDPAGRLSIRSMPIGGLTLPEISSEIVDKMPAGRFVLSTSFGFTKDISDLNKAKRAIQAMDWRRLARPRKNDFIHISSAGNEGTRTDDSRYAALSSTFNVAAAFDSPFDLYAPGEIGLVDSLVLQAYWAYTLSVSPFNSLKMDNVIVVGASDVNGSESSFSNKGSTVRTQGEDVAAPCLRVDPADVDGGCFETADGLHISYYDGTSFSTPQIAGLAAYLLSLDPLLSNSEIKEIIYNAFVNSTTPGFVDAYLAVQSLDTPFNNWDIRRTLLDVADGNGLPGANGEFDRADIVLFQTKFAEYEQLRAGVPDAPADYSRYDLNGDGFTGGTNYVAKFDLDVNQPQDFSAVSIAAGGQTLQLDENLLVDLDVLCYYARTSLYTGPTNALDSLMVDCPCSQQAKQDATCRECPTTTDSIVVPAIRNGTLYVSADLFGGEAPVVTRRDLPSTIPYFFGTWIDSVTAAQGAASARARIRDEMRYDSLTKELTFYYRYDGECAGGQCQNSGYSWGSSYWKFDIDSSCAVTGTIRAIVSKTLWSPTGDGYSVGEVRLYIAAQSELYYQFGRFVTQIDTTFALDLPPGNYDLQNRCESSVSRFLCPGSNSQAMDVTVTLTIRPAITTTALNATAAADAMNRIVRSARQVRTKDRVLPAQGDSPSNFPPDRESRE